MDSKLTTSNKDAMSRALGAAFLSHQVEQLEKTVSTTPPSFGHHSSDRRDRRSLSFGESAPRGRGGPKRGGAGRGHGGIAGNAPSHRPGEGESHRPQKFESRGRETDFSDVDDKDGEKTRKDADVVVVDSSILVHAIGELKKWCRYSREEIVIVPLEALNTLDMLKKGSSALAQRARAASRILEQQVGTNPRIIVQRDDAFVLWDDIPITSQDSTSESATDINKNLEVEARMTPEWLRRTICCARWEVEHVQETLAGAGRKVESTTQDNVHKLKVVLAVCIPPSVTESNAVSTIVPDLPMLNKHEQRASGVLVSLWANRSGVPVLKIESSFSSGGNHSLLSNGVAGNITSGGGQPRSSQARHNRGSSDEDRRSSPAISGGGRARGGSIGRSKAGNKPHYSLAAVGGEKLVERPATTVAMNASAMLQPTRVVRVLARGEKLEP